MTGTEGYLEVEGGRVWHRSVGEGGTPLLCLHGGPGFTHYYLEPLETLADRRQVIFYDQLGCGRSDRPVGPASMIRWVSDCTELLSAQPAEVRQVIAEHEAAGFTACPEYQAAILGFYRERVCRLSPWPASLERSFAEAGYEVYNTMNGPSEFTVTGTLKTWDAAGRVQQSGEHVPGPPGGHRPSAMTSDLRVLVRVPAAAEGAPHTWMTVMRCAFGRPGSSTSLFRSTGSLVSTTTGRCRPSAVAATTASTEQRSPGRPVAPRSSPAWRPSAGLTGTTVIRDSTRCTATSRGAPLNTSVRVTALATTRARRAIAVSR
jgi:hypothetical protein